MVGRGLKCEIHRHVDAARGGGSHEIPEFLDRAELGMDGGVAALGRADRVDAAGVAGRRDQGVVAALALGAPDRVDRREVDDVEAELRETRELGLDAGEAAPRAREELIPGPEAGPHPLDLDRRDEVHPRRGAAIGGARGGRDHLRAERVRGALGEAALAVLEHGGRLRSDCR